MLEVKELVKTFGDFEAVDHVSFTIPDGEILGLIGQNGVGRTATFRLILDFLTQDNGSALWDGQPLNEKEHDIISYLPEGRGLHPKIAIEDQLIYFASLRGETKKGVEPKIDLWVGEFQIKSRRTGKVRSLSKGSQQKVQLIATLIHEPRLIILDEPFSGLDLVSAELLKDGIVESKNQGSCVIFSGHNMDDVEEICDYLVVSKNGRVVLDGQVREIRQQFGRTKLFLESPLSVEKVAATAGMKEAHLRQDGVLEAILESAEMDKVLFDRVTTNGYIPMFNQQPPTLGGTFKMEVGRQDK